MKLREAKCDNDQLICCLHSAAGCRKSTVIELVMEYAREYCSFLPHVTFIARMIVVTAMTGVSATIILGETTGRREHTTTHSYAKRCTPAPRSATLTIQTQEKNIYTYGTINGHSLHSTTWSHK